MVPIYLEEFEVCSPPDAWRVDYEKAVAGFRQWEHVGEDGIAFVRKVYKLIGMSPTRTFLPPWVNPQFIAKPEVSLDRAHDEAMVTVVGTARQLLQKAGVGPGDIDIVVTACSVYCPTPSMSALLVNQLGLRPDVLSYSLGGMGCSSGVLGLQLAQELLQVYRDKRALFVAAEMTTPACYTGTDKARYLANTLFRAGGAAALLTNHASAAHTAKYRMVATTRSHGAADDEAYGAVHFGPDKDGVNGLLLSNHLPKYAGKVLERCVRQIAPKIMTWGQYAEAATWYVKDAIEAHLSGSSTSKAGAGKDTYIPDFTRCIDHFAIHAGGYVVVKAIQESMKLPPAAVMSSMASLMDFGNTSVSLTWYAWAYCEAVQNVKHGHRVLQMGVGSGVKGAVVAWEALKDIPAGGHPAWAHLGGKPYTDADLPRSLMETPQTDAFLAKAMDQDRRP